ncbi:MAG: ATP-binding cassette domain-containing protein, partial [Bacillota bacterium]
LKGLCSFFNKADRHIVRHALELVDMWGYRHRLIGELSGGQLQRVYVARALALNPEIFVMDEPATGIDTQARERLYSLLGMLNKNLGITVIVVSHDLDRILPHAKTVMWVDRGVTYCGPAGIMPAKIRAVLAGECQEEGGVREHA